MENQVLKRPNVLFDEGNILEVENANQSLNNQRQRKKPICSVCGTEDGKSWKRLKKLKCEYFCRECLKEKKKNHREFLRREVIGIRKKEDIMKEAAERKKLNEKLVKERLPIIKGVKVTKKKISTLGLWLTNNEKLVLYRKYVKKGLNPKEASDKIKGITTHLEELVKQMREKNKSEKEINIRFKEEFAKLCQSV